MGLDDKRCWVCNRSHEVTHECRELRARRDGERLRALPEFLGTDLGHGHDVTVRATVIMEMEPAEKRVIRVEPYHKEDVDLRVCPVYANRSAQTGPREVPYVYGEIKEGMTLSATDAVSVMRRGWRVSPVFEPSVTYWFADGRLFRDNGDCVGERNLQNFAVRTGQFRTLYYGSCVAHAGEREAYPMKARRARQIVVGGGVVAFEWARTPEDKYEQHIRLKLGSSVRLECRDVIKGHPGAWAYWGLIEQWYEVLWEHRFRTVAGPPDLPTA